MRLKKCKSIDIDSKLKEYLIRNSDKSNLSDSIKEFFGQVAQNREVMVKIDECVKNPEQIKENIKIITIYINQLNLLRKKMTFGKEKYSCKIEFNWIDTVKNVVAKSLLIEFEICNSMYNLATYYFYEGLKLSKTPSATKEIRKEALTNFKYALYLYNWIKEEAKKIPDKESAVDLQETYMNYCITLCEIYGQLEIYNIAKETNPKSFDLHSQLLMQVSDLYKRGAGFCASMQIKKSINELVTFFQNRSVYYKGKMFLELKNNAKKEFDETGVGYGKVCYIQNLALNEFLECQKTIKKLGKLLKVEDFEVELKKVEDEKKEVDDLNYRIYHQADPKPEEIKYEPKNMMIKVLPDELYIEENEPKAKNDERIFCPDLDVLAPKEVREMLGKYKPQINELISQNLDQCENEGTISNFIQELNLPKKLTRRDESEEDDDGRELPQELWEKIEKIQQIGGVNGLHNIMQGIFGKSNYLIKQLQNLLHSFELEDKDDNNMRQRYKDKWIREPSLKLNYQMVQAAQSYIKGIQQTQTFDQQASSEIDNNSYYFNELMMPLIQLNQNIPFDKKPKVDLTPEENEVRTAILKLYELSDKCTTIIKPLFSKANEDSAIIDLFMDVLNNKATEQAVYAKNKAEFEQKFGELKLLSAEVKKQEEKVSELVQKHHDVIMPKIDPIEENRIMDYFRHLDEIANMFMAKHDKIMKGDNYYNELKEKVDKLIKFGNDWMIKRNDEKNALLKSFNKSAYSMYAGTGSLGQMGL